MEHIDINELVESIQKKLSTALRKNVPAILDYYKRQPDLLFNEMMMPKNGCSDELGTIIEYIRYGEKPEDKEKKSKKQESTEGAGESEETVKPEKSEAAKTTSMLNSIISRRSYLGINREEVWDEFVDKKLPRLILSFDKMKIANYDFISYLSSSLVKFSVEFSQRNKRKMTEDVDTARVEKRATYRPGAIRGPEEIIFPVENIRFLVEFVDRYNGRVEKKIVYHCMKFLVHCHQEDGFITLSEFKEEHKTMKKTSEHIEYLYELSFQIKTNFMVAIINEIEVLREKGNFDDEFLKDVDPDTKNGKATISNYVNDIHKRLKGFLKEFMNEYRKEQD